MANVFPPQPSVEHLVTVFRRIDACNLLAPAFQRSFVWKEDQILALLESVYEGFPIGSILLWRVESQILKRNQEPEIPFPTGKVSYPAYFILDGLQRLSSLYGVFYYDAERMSDLFNVHFDLGLQRFVGRVDADELGDSELLVPLNALFSPRKLLEIQNKLLKKSNGDALVEAVLDLQARFQDYMVPIVTLSQTKPEDVVTIFERINSTGTRLSPVDFMRAITWSSEFDLNKALARLSNKLEKRGFQLGEDALVKALGLVFDLDPLPSAMLKLRERSANELEDGMRSVQVGCELVIEFLKSTLGIRSADYLPYEGQFLVLFNIFKAGRKPNKEQADALARWFLSVSISETLQGRPDHYVARMIRKLTLSSQHSDFDVPAMRLEKGSLSTRRMLKKAALSTGIVTLWAKKNARHLVRGSIIDAKSYMAGYEANMISAVLDLDDLNKSLKTNQNTPKTISNSVLHWATEDVSAFDAISILARKGDKTSIEILESQLIPLNAAKDLVAGRSKMFLDKRAKWIFDELKKEIDGSGRPA